MEIKNTTNLSEEEIYERLDKICKSFDDTIMETTSIEKIAIAIMHKVFREETTVFNFLTCGFPLPYASHIGYSQYGLEQFFITIVEQCMNLTRIPKYISNKDGKFLVSLLDDFINKNKLKGIKVSSEENSFNVALDNEIISFDLDEVDLGIKLNKTKIKYTGNPVKLKEIKSAVVCHVIAREL